MALPGLYAANRRSAAADGGATDHVSSREAAARTHGRAHKLETLAVARRSAITAGQTTEDEMFVLSPSIVR
jgi:hypothetical protein